ncbi:nitrate- and nitrite sensing domain-containing protein [Umezawaea sp. Da 62-37]|uniref:sensor histidine kinase n=1 Tax=Umezawaea sp. Da 62-37 TaxID=3075927 RepID=UPI0028F6C737|nr:nitrate- and nitrite sensing domain-containing protein [Umezawaea sp. Da 62-37]WNV88837.1 nitrate- and nitrite sensing domain-containing protein [Umezawaea sp. Da 62-37]
MILLVMWLAFSSYTVFDGFYIRAVASSVKDASIPAVNTFVAIQRERQLAMTALSETSPDLEPLRAQQRQVDQAVTTMKTAFDELTSSAPPEVNDRISRLNATLGELQQRRAQVEAGKVAKNDIYTYYNGVIDAGTALFGTQARIVPDNEAGQGGLNATELFRAADWMSRASSIASGGLTAGELSDADHLEFAHLIGSYHSSLVSTMPFAEPRVQQMYADLEATDSWRRLNAAEDRLVGSPSARVELSEWQSLIAPVSEGLVSLAVTQASAASDVGLSNGNSKFLSVIIGSLVALIVVLGGIMLAVRISHRLVNKALVTRLIDLKKDSLQLAHERLPSIVERLRKGEHVDVEAEVPLLDYGKDEIGQVADAFNAAQFTAVAAAVKESQVRDGVNRVFLDIAHRNQGLVHRQLKILDKLEREEENPEQLDALFQLDHLATRARRNAENLIILAGEQPGRQWRKPVRMIDILRAGVAETEQYVRVKVNPVPETALVGAAVADTIHLIAELVDNATAFSSPRSQVQVHSSQVPQGIVVEIEDHGLGMNPDDRARSNKMLANPPEFDAMSLRGESRLGLFVVARLADRRGIRVELRESLYGGTLALVLIPSEIVAGSASLSDSADSTEVGRRPVPEAVAAATGAPAALQGGSGSAEDARFPGATSDFSSGVDDFWAKAETDVAGHPDPGPTRSRMIGQVELPSRPKDTQWPVDDPEATGVVNLDEVAGGDRPVPNDRPELPRRRRQQNLAPQLAQDDPYATAPPPAPLAEADMERSAERTRKGLSAFQQGAREARRGDNALES